ncbi:MAG TPA: hypothetical protein VLR93_01080 [Patescibacteria group bacterium]|nr:hypothetical protein [Patescibacteria group bacterium]
MTRLARLAASPTARQLVANAARSETTRDLARQAVRDPRGLVRQLADPATAHVIFRKAVQDPAVREAARLGMVFMPVHYAVLGNAALWGARRVVRRYRETPGGETLWPDRRRWADRRRPPMKNVTPEEPDRPV